MKNLLLLLAIFSTVTAFTLITAHRFFPAPPPIQSDIFAQKFNNPNWFSIVPGVKITAVDLVKNHSEALGLQTDDKLKLYRTDADGLGFKHYRFQQYYKGLEVDGAELLVHEKNNAVETLNGGWVRGLQLDASPNIDAATALEIALAHVGADSYNWEDPGTEQHLKRAKNDQSATFYPQPELVIQDPKFEQNARHYRLAYRMTIHAQEPLSIQQIYVDAKTGKIYDILDMLQTADVSCTAHTKYQGEQNMIVDSVAADHYRLREAGRGQGIETYNMLRTRLYGNAVDFTDEDNYWDNVNEFQDEAATDAHWGSEMTYDYFFDRHNFASFDGQASKMLSFIHYDSSYVNAFWNGHWTTFGDGNGTTYSALTSLDVMGHEYTHGVTRNTANLVYRNESGALNESFSDIFGESVEIFAIGGNDWFIGKDFNITGNGFRSMKNPKAMNDPDTYFGQFFQDYNDDDFDNGGVHSSSGVQNYWFYLLVEGDTDTNDNGDDYSVTGIGLVKAQDISFRNLRFYLSRNSKFDDARAGALQSATDLYGECSTEFNEVANAWYAVGVGGQSYVNDVQLNTILYPPNYACGLFGEEKITVEMRYKSCGGGLLPGDEIPLAYQVNETDTIYETMIVDMPINDGDVFTFTFSSASPEFWGIDVHDVKVWMELDTDLETYNNSLSTTVQNVVPQNLDFGMINIIQPTYSCGDETANVQVRYGFYGCDSLAAGTEIALTYRLNGDATVTETFPLPTTMFPEQTGTYTFEQTIDLAEAGDYTVDVWTAYSADFLTLNDSVTNHHISKPVLIDSWQFNTYEDSLASLPYARLLSGSKASATISAAAAHDSEFGIHLTGSDGHNDQSYNDLILWETNPNFAAQLCYCVDATEWDNAFLEFDKRQTYSMNYLNEFGFNNPAVCGFRVTVNDQQISDTYLPETFFVDPWETLTFELTEYAGTNFEICLESRCFYSPEGDPEGNGDNVYIDNVFIGDELFATGIDELTALQFSIYPNPSTGIFTLSYPVPAAKPIHANIFNLYGQLIQSFDFQATTAQNIAIDLRHEAKGMYFVELTDGVNSSVAKVVVR